MWVSQAAALQASVAVLTAQREQQAAALEELRCTVAQQLQVCVCVRPCVLMNTHTAFGCCLQICVAQFFFFASGTPFFATELLPHIFLMNQLLPLAFSFVSGKKGNSHNA